MKARLESERGSGSEWLTVHLTQGERLDPDRLAWLRGRPHRYLLALDHQDHGLMTYRYNVTGLESLRSFLRSYEITSLQYENVLVSLGEVIGMLRHEHQDEGCLLLDERYIFSDMDGNLWFVLLPVTSAEHHERKGKTPEQVFLDRLSRSRHLAYSSADDLARAGRLRKLVRGEGFSAKAYESFLVEEYGIRLDFSDTAQEIGRGGHEGMSPRWDSLEDGAITRVAKVGERPIRVSAGEWSGGGRTTTFRLVMLDGSDESYALGDCRTVLVGRGSGCDVRIAGNQRISRVHARIERDGTGFRVTDLGSSNGTMVRGLELHDGESERVELGEAFELADVPMAIRTA